MSTVIIGSIVVVVLFFIGRKIYKDKRSGKSLCGGKCSGCANCCSCHKDKAK